MTASCRALIAVCVAVLTAPLAAMVAPAAQTLTPQAASTSPPRSTAVVVGQVVDGLSGEPIPEAVVSLRGLGAGPRGAGPSPFPTGRATAPPEQRRVAAGDGRFVFHSLPPGQFQVTASMPGYAPSLTPSSSSVGLGQMLVMGATATPGSPASTSLVLAEGEVMKDVKVRLWKYAAVEGVVLDDNGEPAVALTVLAVRRTSMGGRARYVPAGSGRTDDRGAYRISSLLPADYVFVVQQAHVALPAAVIETLVSMGTSGSVGGDMSAAEAAVEALFSAGGGAVNSISGGVRMGNYLVAGSSGAVPFVNADGRVMAFQTTFHGGATAPMDAAVITLASGEQRSAVDFRLRLTPTVRVAGVATGPAGPVPNLAVRLVVPADGVATDTDVDVASTVSTADGRFAFHGVPPGQFAIRAQKQPGGMAGLAPPGIAGAAPASPPSRVLFAQADIAVGATNVDDVVLTLAEGFTIRGRVEVDRAARATLPVGATRNLGLVLTPALGRVASLFTLPRPNRVSDDFTFETAGLVPGSYFMTMSPLPPSWQVKTISVAGRDVFDGPIEIRNADISGVVVTLTDSLPALTGGLTASAPLRASEALVVIWPADFRAWIAQGMNPRLARTARPDPTGRYTS